MTGPSLSILIVTYNSREEIGPCLDSLIETPPLLDHDIVVIDNASQDGTAAFVRERWPAVRVVEAGRNLGFAAANNLGFHHSSGELVLLLNPDTIVSRGSLDTLASTLMSRPEVAAAGPRLVDREGRSELSFGSMPSPLTDLRQKMLVRGHPVQLPGISRAVETMTREPREVGWVSGACLLVRRTDANDAGLLDERYFMYLEDVDFCAELRAHGRKVLFVPEAEVVHLRGQSRRSAPTATEQAYRRSQVAFYEKHHPGWAPVLRAYLRLRGKLGEPPGF
jgi:GT2 family glycosyltransferase